MAREEIITTPTCALQGYWRLGEASGQRNDSHVSLHLSESGGTIGSATGLLPGTLAAAFDGTAKSLIRNSERALQVGGETDWTVAFWVRFNSLNLYGLVAKSQESVPEWEIFARTNQAEFRIWNGTGYQGTNKAFTFVVNTWYFISLRYSAETRVAEIDVNASRSPGSVTLTADIPSGTDQFRISHNAAGFGHLNGRLALCGFWKSGPNCGGRLTNLQLSWLFNGGAGRDAIMADWAPEFERRIAMISDSATLAPEGNIGRLTLQAGNYQLSRPVNAEEREIIAGRGPGVSRIMPASSWGYVPLLPGFEDCIAPVTAALHKVSLTGVMTYATQKYGYRTRATSLGVMLSTPFDCGPSPGGWPSLTQLTIAFAFRREAGAWTVAGLFGCSDGSNKIANFSADASPYNCGIITVGGNLSVLLRLKDAQGEYHDFSFPLGGSPPQILRGIFQINFVTGAVQAWYASSATNWPQVAVSLTAADTVNFPTAGAWTPGRTLDHNFFASCQLGGAGVGSAWGERYSPFDQTLTGFCISGDLRFQDRGVGQQLRLIGSATDVGADANPDELVYNPASPAGASGFGAKLYLTDGHHATATEWWLVPWYGGASGMGYWLDVAESIDFTASITFRDLSLLGGFGVAGSNTGGAGVHFKQFLELNFDHCELGYSQHGIAKLGTGTAYVVNLDHCRINFCTASALAVGYGMTHVESTNVAHWGRCIVASSGTLSWDGFNLCSDSVNAVHAGLFHGPGAQLCRLQNVIVNFEGGGPNRGHFVFDSIGAVEFDPSVVFSGVIGGTGLPGKSFITLRGSKDGTAQSVFNRPGRLVVRDQLVGTLAIGQGPFVTRESGIWEYPPAAPVSPSVPLPPVKTRHVHGDSFSIVYGTNTVINKQVILADGTAADLSGYDLKFQLIEDATEEVVFSADELSGLVIPSSAGKLSATLPATSASQSVIGAGPWRWYILNTQPTPDVTLFSGRAYLAVS